MTRIRRTRDQVEQLDQQILDILVEDNPQSIRHVFYRMTDPRLAAHVDKTHKGYRDVQGRIRDLRRAGRLPYDWIVDSSRYGYHTDTYRGTGDFLRQVAGLYRADIWRQSDYYCEVWVESRSIAGVVQGDCRELAVPLYPSGGFTSMSMAYQAAEHINASHDGREVRILYIGDYDPSGVLIDVSVERELRQHLDVPFDFQRIAITPEQIAELDLPTKPRKEGDRRALHVEFAVEAEAMPAGITRRLLRDHIELLLPPRALEVARVAEEEERRFLLAMAEHWPTDD